MMRKFSSYGPPDNDLNYYAPRTALVETALGHLLGDDSAKGGHYITVWAPRQTGKTWVMQQVLWRLQKQYTERFDVLKINLQHLQWQPNVDAVVAVLAEEIARNVEATAPAVTGLHNFQPLFAKQSLPKPLILILDEFDALPEEAIRGLAAIFRNMYVNRQDHPDKTTDEQEYRLHGVALIGVRSVLGIENVSGSPFNVQRSLHIPNLTAAEVTEMFHWYARESGQTIALNVIEKVYAETQGQPGLVSWFGELLTETYNPGAAQAITATIFERVYAEALYALPNNTVLNILSKVKQPPYTDVVMEFFKTGNKVTFAYDQPELNYLYLNGVIEREQISANEGYVKFACPFVQKRIFNYFSHVLFHYVGQLHDPFLPLEDILTENALQITPLLRLYEQYLHANRHWLLKDAPRRSDLRIYEAVYHFNLYMYLNEFLRRRGGQVWPEFPTGNGKIDLIMRYAGRMYGLELKSYTDAAEYRAALQQAARYGQQLQLTEITVAFFVEVIDDANRQKYETIMLENETGVSVSPVFVATGKEG